MQKVAYLDFQGKRLLPLLYNVGFDRENEFDNFKTALKNKLAKDDYFRRKVNEYPIVERPQVGSTRNLEVNEDTELIHEETLLLRFVAITPAKENQSEETQACVLQNSSKQPSIIKVI
jgi:hypothetical protein